MAIPLTVTEKAIGGLTPAVSVSATPTTTSTIGEYLKNVPGYGIFTSTSHGYPGMIIDPGGNGAAGQAVVVLRRITEIKLYGGFSNEKLVSNLPYHFFHS